MQIIHVVSFSPTELSGNAVGGFDWFLVRDAAVEHLVESVRHPIGGPGYNWALVELPVRSELVNEYQVTRDETAITELIDANLQAIEPKGTI